MVKDRQSSRILREAWTLWSQKYQVSFADQRYNAKVLLLGYLKWKDTFQRIDKIEGRAEHLVALRDHRLLVRGWEGWRTTARIIRAEKELSSRIHARIMWQVWSAWRKRTYVATSIASLTHSDSLLVTITVEQLFSENAN